jgi:3-isopropylmalate/(R)-2-methylmalate dehydratase large subunit
MKPPKKEELLKLQKEYKTDKRIAEAIGVPKYLVTYWRKKKKIDKHIFPKYSEETIKDLWERFGNDEKAGEELSISAAAFYKWRQKYNIKERPKVLKLAQLEFDLSKSSANTAQTIAQKILASKVGKREVQVGEIVEVEPDIAMSHDNAGLVIKQFKEIGVEKVWNPNRIVIPLDHRAPAESEKTATAHRSIRLFVKEQGIRNFYDIKEGVCHEIMVDKAHILPGQLAVGTDSHTTSYGCIGAISTGIGATEMAAVWATGKVWLKVPESIKIILKGKLPLGVYAKDVILYIIKELTSEGANYKSVEFYGEPISFMSISERFTLCNLSMEMGAKFAIVPFDKITKKFLSKRTKKSFQPVWADENAIYEKKYEFEISKLEPQIACPHSLDNVKPVSAIKGTKIDQVVLGSCTNGRLDDLEIAARILKGRKVHPDTRMLVIPCSKTIYLEALKKGIIRTFLEADCVVLNPGCGPCLGAHEGILAAGEKCLATTNRNFKGRMGSPESEVYLASPATAAASAIKGEIADPRDFLRRIWRSR